MRRSIQTSSRGVLILSTLCPCLLLLSACATKSPVLYPNTHYQNMGEVQAAEDVSYCMQLADNTGLKTAAGSRVAKETVVSAGVGAATGAAWEAAMDNAAGTAGASAAAAGTAGLLRSLMTARDPNRVYKNFVEQCLRERGYQPVGWQ
ncbi:MAG: hypothetical protein R3231_07785 [bacterium]|nr:hypothetical protein [bacterium]